MLPPAEASTGVDTSLTGGVPVQVDFSNYLADRLPLFFGVVLGLSFLLLMTVFRSVLVPLKAVLMNLLSIGASYGVAVAVFQWGWLSAITGVEPAPIEPFVPMMLFAIVFGLSMDYEVFLLSRVREEWVRTGDSRTSVADGLASTARVISAAAAIMVFLFGSFLLEQDRIIKLFGLGLAVAVAARRHHHPHAPGAGHHGAPGRQELVAAEVAREDPAQGQRRRQPRGHRRPRTGAGLSGFCPAAAVPPEAALSRCRQRRRSRRLCRQASATTSRELVEAMRRRRASHALRSLRRSSSEVAPQTPASWFVARANSRQSSRASQARQTALAASIWSNAGPVVPTGKNKSGSVYRQDARRRQSSTSHSYGRFQMRATAPPSAFAA